MSMTSTVENGKNCSGGRAIMQRRAISEGSSTTREVCCLRRSRKRLWRCIWYHWESRAKTNGRQAYHSSESLQDRPKQEASIQWAWAEASAVEVVAGALDDYIWDKRVLSHAVEQILPRGVIGEYRGQPRMGASEKGRQVPFMRFMQRTIIWVFNLEVWVDESPLL